MTHKLQLALNLIAQLPANHDGRNTFLLNYDKSDRGGFYRSRHIHHPRWIPILKCAETNSDKIYITTIPQILKLTKLKMSLIFDQKVMGKHKHPAAFLINQNAGILLNILSKYKPYILKEEYFIQLAKNC